MDTVGYQKALIDYVRVFWELYTKQIREGRIYLSCVFEGTDTRSTKFDMSASFENFLRTKGTLHGFSPLDSYRTAVFTSTFLSWLEFNRTPVQELLKTNNVSSRTIEEYISELRQKTKYYVQNSPIALGRDVDQLMAHGLASGIRTIVQLTQLNRVEETHVVPEKAVPLVARV